MNDFTKLFGLPLVLQEKYTIHIEYNLCIKKWRSGYVCMGGTKFPSGEGNSPEAALWDLRYKLITKGII